MKLNNLASKLQETDIKSRRVKAVESELGLETQKRLPPEMTALYRAVFNKLRTAPVSQPSAESQTTEPQPGQSAETPTGSM